MCRRERAVIHDQASTTATQKPSTLQVLPAPLAMPTKPARKTTPVTIEYAAQPRWRSAAKRG